MDAQLAVALVLAEWVLQPGTLTPTGSVTRRALPSHTRAELSGSPPSTHQGCLLPVDLGWVAWLSLAEFNPSNQPSMGWGGKQACSSVFWNGSLPKLNKRPLWMGISWGRRAGP